MIRFPEVPAPPPPRAAAPSTLAEAVFCFGRDTVAFQSLAPGMRAWSDGAGAWVAFADTGRAWLAVGSPLCAPEDTGRVARAFVQAARAAGRRAGFCAVEAFPHDTFFERLPLGRQPIWDPLQWDRVLAGRRSLREQIRRARAKGVRARVASAQELGGELGASIAALAAGWLAGRRGGPLGFLLAVDLFYRPSERLYVVAERGDRLVGLLAAVPVPGRGGWFFEDILRADDAPNGTVELLVDAAMRWLAVAGCRRVTMGLVPFAGPLPHPLRILRRLGHNVYDFEGLRVFRARFAPEAWEPVWFVHPRGTSEIVSLWDVASALTGGRPLRFALRAWTDGKRRRRRASAG
ncbi:phosphatidylglycerol lysyltransferase domain-containing protein [Polyangium sp. y55x31]|uniref:phosphatidylglycerol lysyltransferase domain-containing protein n=1 Tax=Polyangium sp. y55x31 TaxID=3042688 RepID=UPI002482B686|nr:phosphatidylglycerol lysyltransferase domain-containing protein [Polyangium sp. y55x31]MDI1475759.1 phosphatidylglycerol lysyltransferase domain-containing protein [Polyangium sp. y55x31]